MIRSALFRASHEPVVIIQPQSFISLRLLSSFINCCSLKKVVFEFTYIFFDIRNRFFGSVLGFLAALSEASVGRLRAFPLPKDLPLWPFPSALTAPIGT